MLNVPPVTAPDADYDDAIPRVYSNVAEEYEAAVSAAALADRSSMGRLDVTGEDALDLLNRLSTNKVNDLPTGRGLYTVVTTNKGRIVDLIFLLRLEERLLAVTSPQTPRAVAEWIEFYTFIEDVSVADNGGDSAMLGVSGPAAAGILDRVSGGSVSELAPYSSTTTSLGGAEALVVRTDFLGGPGYDLVLPSSDRDTAWRELLDAGSGLGLKPAGSDALEALRIDRGRPAYGRELTQDFNPLEAGLEGYVSFNKECYIGQEVVARLNAYDKVQRRLVGLAWEGEYEPPPGAELRAGGRRVGVLTSVAASPRSPGRVGLGYVHRRHAEPGAALEIAADGEGVEARIRAVH